jgi:hypothetical protein
MSAPNWLYKKEKFVATSDIVYRPGSGHPLLWGNTAPDQTMESESIREEFNREALMLTSEVLYKTTEDGGRATSIWRRVLVGNMTYEGTRLSGISVSTVIEYSAYKTLTYPANAANTPWPILQEIKVVNLPSAFTYKDIYSEEEDVLFDAFITTSGVVSFFYDDFPRESDGAQPINTSSVEEFQKLPEARYFESGWIAAPTATNALPDIDLQDTPKEGETQTIERKEIDLNISISGPSAKQDDLIGTASDDTIAAGKGADKLTGDSGADQFVFNTPDQFGKKGADIITDFNPGQGDQIVISPNALPGLGSNPSLVVATSKKHSKQHRSQSLP